MLSCTFTVFSIMLSIHAHAATIVTDGLVSYWTFDLHETKDGIAQDVWGENHATIKGNPKIADGHLRQGLKFDGVGDYVILENLGNFSSRIGESSIEFWVKTSYKKSWTTLFKVVAPPCDQQHRGWGITINASLKRDGFFNHFANPQVRGFKRDVIFKEGGMLVQYSNKNPNGCRSISSPFHSPISDGKWHQIVYVNGVIYIDESGLEWREDIIYIDGIRKSLLRSRGAKPQFFVPYTEPVFLGATNDNGKPKRFFRGIMDEVRVYNRTLNGAEVIQNFQSGIGLSVEPTQKLPTVWGALKARR